MAYTEFYCNASTGNNTYAGSTEGAPVLTLTGGDWVSATGVYTKTGAITGVSVGMFAAVMVDGGTVAALVGRVTAVTANTVTISTTAKSGSLADQTATATINVGGAWKGPNAAVNFPFGTLTVAAVNASSNIPRVNLKNNADYSISAAIVTNTAGPIVVQGYSSTPGDRGRATIKGSTAGASHELLTPGSSNTRWKWADLIIKDNGASGTNALINATSAANNLFTRCKIQGGRGWGLILGAQNIARECEITGCNQSNTASTAGVSLAGASLVRCNIHDNAGSNGNGAIVFGTNGAAYIFGCIFDSNGGQGILLSGGTGASLYISQSDFYNNSGDGIRHGGTVTFMLDLDCCNFVKNGGYGINRTGAGNWVGEGISCGFGTGTNANASGATNNLDALEITESTNYPTNSTPWNDPANGDFSIVLAAAQTAGVLSYPGITAVGRPDIGAIQASMAWRVWNPVQSWATEAERHREMMWHPFGS